MKKTYMIGLIALFLAGCAAHRPNISREDIPIFPGTTQLSDCGNTGKKAEYYNKKQIKQLEQGQFDVEAYKYQKANGKLPEMKSEPIEEAPIETESAPAPEKKEKPALKKNNMSEARPASSDISRRLAAVERLARGNKDRIARAEDLIKYEHPKTDVSYVKYSAGKSTLSPAAIKYLNEKIALHKAGKIMIKAVIGSASTVGNKAKNQKLSESRAQTIANYLKNKGVEVPVVGGDGETDRYNNGQRAALLYSKN